MTIAHDSHNVIIIGDNDQDMVLALKEIKQIGGGITVVSKGKVIDSLQLEVVGLMTNKSDLEVEKTLEFLEEEVRKLGVSEQVDDPFLS
jgi:adenine deaminase